MEVGKSADLVLVVTGLPSRPPQHRDPPPSQLHHRSQTQRQRGARLERSRSDLRNHQSHGSFRTFPTSLSSSRFEFSSDGVLQITYLNSVVMPDEAEEENDEPDGAEEEDDNDEEEVEEEDEDKQ